MQIVPMRDLKDTVRIEQLCAGDNGPVFVTKNGYGRLVVMDIEYFEKTMKQDFEWNALKWSSVRLNNSPKLSGE